MCVECACVHRYVCHQLSSVQKSKTLPVSNTITDIVCQVWDAPRRAAGETAVDPLMASRQGLWGPELCHVLLALMWLSGVAFFLPGKRA